MSNRILWAIAVIVTLASAVYQRMTGPTYPVHVHAELGDAAVKGRLLRSHTVGADMPVKLRVDAPAAVGEVRWRRFPTDEPWHETPLARDGDGDLTAALPAQPASGKLEYRIRLQDGAQTLVLPADRAVVARFKGAVPPVVLAFHILLIFSAMLWSNRAGLEAVVDGPRRARLAVITLGLFLVGGCVLGPIVQKYSFGAYWTGWPFGGDTTDNKVAVAALAWIWAAVAHNRGRGARAVTVIAALVMLAVFMIPHSMNGSTLDYETMKTLTG